jgi:hypothetical protein
MSLSEWLVQNILSESKIKEIVVIYPGRFQPMGRHHAAVYKKLASQFGKSNTYIATSDVVNPPKSPLNFREKLQVMKQHGITNVVQVKNPYQSLEIVNKYDPETTAVLFAVGKKDMQEDPRFRVGAKKNGEPSYFQYYDENKGNLQPYGKHGYLIVAPHVDIQIPGFGEMSGTTLRQVLATADEKTFKDVMGFYDASVHGMLKKKFAPLKSESVKRANENKETVAFSKKWWSTLILEGRYDTLVNRLSREIVDEMKSGKGTRNYHTYFEIVRGDRKAEVDLVVKFKPQHGLSDYAYETKGSTDGYDMDIVITYNPALFPQSYSTLIAEIKETLRHELEHVSQENFQDMYTFQKKGAPYYRYLLYPHEIAAYAQGLYKRAKVKRIPIDIAMEEWFEENVRNFSRSQKYNHWSLVKKTWLDYARKHIPSAQYSTDINEGVKDWLKSLKKKGGELKQSVINGVKRESAETKKAVEIIGKMVKGEPVSDKEKIFVKAQSKDLVKILPLIAIQGIPVPIPITPFLIMLGEKFGFSILPNSHKTMPLSALENVNQKSNNMIKLKPLIIKEAKANTHLTHLEELILTQGRDGYNLARTFLLELIKNLKGSSNTKVNTTIKWDGAPAIFSGVDPDSGRFFVGTKSVFNKEPKLNFTNEDIERNHGDAPGLVDKLKRALKHLPTLGYKNILQGDFMFDDSTLKTQTINGVKHYTFRPNTITYAVEADSELGRKIARAKFGIVFHTGYRNLQSGAEFGASVSNLKETPDVWFDDAFFKDTTGTVMLTDAEGKRVASLIKEADAIKVDYRSIPSELLNTYINSEIRIGQFLESPTKSYDAFVKWVELRNEKAIDKLKSLAGKEKAMAAATEQIKSIQDSKDNIVNAFKISKLLSEAKMIFVQKYNNAVYRTKHFIDDGKGGLQVSNPEGYVAVDHIGNGVKLVDRLEFSRANFTMDKGFTK